MQEVHLYLVSEAFYAQKELHPFMRYTTSNTGGCTFFFQAFVCDT